MQRESDADFNALCQPKQSEYPAHLRLSSRTMGHAATADSFRLAQIHRSMF